MKPIADSAAPMYSLAQLPLLLSLAEIAAQLVVAESNLGTVKMDYYDTIREYEHRHGQLGARINPENPLHARVVAHTAVAHAQVLAAKRRIYNLKRRMTTAARRVNGLTVVGLDT